MRAFSSAVSRLFQIRWLAVTTAAAAVAVFMVLLYIQQPRIVRMLDMKVYDTLLHVYGQKKISPYPVIVDLDEPSLAAYGQWPWPRFLLADLLQKLVSKGAVAVGVDVLLVEPDRSSPKLIQEDLKRFFALDVAFSGLPENLFDYDRLLADTLQKLPVAIGLFVRDFGSEVRAAGAAPDSVGYALQKAPGAPPFEHLPLVAESATFPLPVFWPSVAMGHINSYPDEDGVNRRLALLAQYGDKIYPSLALRTLMIALGKNTLMGRVGPDGLESVRVGSYTIPVSPEGMILVPFKGPSRTFPYISAKDVLSGQVSDDALKGRIVFVGTSAPGLRDLRVSPLDPVMPGVELHATILDTILQQHYLRVPPWTPGAQVLAMLAASVLAALAFGFAKPRVYIVVGAALLGLSVYVSVYFFERGFVVSPLYVLMTVAVQGTLLLFMRFWQEERQKHVLRSAFSRYVAPEIVERITKLRGNIFAGEELEVTIMFTDIRRFTSISEQLKPEQVVTLLNRYFTPMTALVRANKGTLDKFIGDALMAFWNAPVRVPEHPVLAVETALAMQEKLEELNTMIRQDFGCEIAMGVGLHTGTAYVGNMGSEELLNYTLIGDNVNLTSRLEGLCSQYGVKIVVSEETAARCGDRFAFLPLDTLRVKGKQKPVTVFTAMRRSEWHEREAEFSSYHHAFGQYVQGDFAQACQLFAPLVHSYPDTKLYHMYASRCDSLRQAPPKEWEGVWTMTSK